MAEQRRNSKRFLTDEEKRRVLDDLRSSLDSVNVTSDSALAKRVSRITDNVVHLAKSAQTTADLSFTVNLVDYTVDCVTSHLESNDPTRELFHELTIADEISMTSWCPGGYEQLEEITRPCVPLRLCFEKYITLKDLEERRGDPKEAPIREKKKRNPSQLSKAAAVVPKKVGSTDVTPTHQVNMDLALKKLAELTQDAPIPFFNLVINPNSFVQTVYNIFIVSFLVHEEHALLSVNDNDELLIQVSPKPHDAQDNPLESASTIQLVHSISPSEWIALAKHLNLRSPLLPEFCPKDSTYFQDNQLSVDLSSGVTFLEP
uniref:Non-structural maintenance of chromosomes element 4 n=1 Tax=Lygus hesperus TaxID=30085 RepID=A0A0A9Z205_LYGHE